MMKSVDVLVAGDLFVDLILSGFDRWPEPGAESFAREFAREVGGGAAITACGLAKLGIRTRVFGFAGAADSAWLFERLRQSGVDTSAIRLHDSEPTAISVVASSAHDRAFLTYQGANKALPEELRRAAEKGELACARHVHLAFAPDLDSAAGLLDSIRGNQCTISLDVGWHPEWLEDPRVADLLGRVDLFFPNESEALRITGACDADQALERFDALGAARVGMKMGPRGAALLCDGQIFRSAPPRVHAIDVTGAGDCFDAGFLYAWLSGRSPRECLEIANLCGALSTEVRGGIAGFPGLERLAELRP